MKDQHQHEPQRRRGRSFSVAQDTDEELVLFHSMQKKDRERADWIYDPSEPDASEFLLTPKPTRKPAIEQGVLQAPDLASPVKSKSSVDIFSSDWDKNDYDWLLTPPGTPPVSTLHSDITGNGYSLNCAASAKPAAKSSRLGVSKSEPPSRSEPSHKTVHCNLGLHQPASAAQGLSNPVSKASRRSFPLSSNAVPKQTTIAVSGNSVGRTPGSIHMSRPSQPSLIGQMRLSTPNGSTNASGRLSTPSFTPFSRSAGSSRPSTPVKRPPTPVHHGNPPSMLVRSASVNKASSLSLKGGVTPRVSSPSNKASHPAIHGLTRDPSSLGVSNPERSKEAPDTTTRSRRLSSSPLAMRGRLSMDPQKGTGHDVPVGSSASLGYGRKLVQKERHLERPSLASPDESMVTPHVKRPVKSTPLRDIKSSISSTRVSSASGRNLSKKSLDMALKHMDIRKSTTSGFRSFISSFQASSLYSVKSGNRGVSTNSAADSSPMATSSISSSDHSMSIVLDPESSEFGDEIVIDKGSSKSPVSDQPSPLFAISKETRINSWLSSPDYRDDSTDIMQIFEQGIDGVESPLVSQHDGTIEYDDFILEPP